MLIDRDRLFKTGPSFHLPVCEADDGPMETQFMR